MTPRDWVDIHYEGLIVLDGLDDAIVGVGTSFGLAPGVVYDIEKILELLQDQGMGYEEAMEFFDFNIAGLGVGTNAPIFLEKAITND